MDFEELSSQFLHYLNLDKGVSSHTLRAYGIDLDSFLAFGRGEEKSLPLSAISRRLIRRYLSHLHETNKSTRTILRRLSTLRSLYRYALREKLATENPLEEILCPKKGKTLPICIAYSQVQHLLKQPGISCYTGYRDRAIMELFYSSGLRLSEL